MTANVLRQDLLRQGIGKGNYGFKVALPLVLYGQSTYEIDARFSGTDCSLHRPIQVQLAQLEYAQFRRQQLQRLGKVAKIRAAEGSPGITIVIPIFNAYEAVQACLQSVIEQTSIAATLLLINDASSDPRIAPLLDEMAAYPQVQVIHHDENWGYTRTINQGIQQAGETDVVLLNSDTIVGPCWLQQLRTAAYHDVDIATVTAVSNNAGAFSVPEIGQSNDRPRWLAATEFVRAIAHSSQSLYPEVPTGNGFCLYIRRAALDQIGAFDAAAFPRGYGEENDFCLRALRSGWRHVIDDRTLVYHVRSASFQEEKTTLNQAGRQIIDQRYPEYKSLIRVFQQSPELQAVRYQVRRLMQDNQRFQRRLLPRVLYVISTQTGGTPQTNADLMRGLSDRYHPFLLHCDRQTITLYDSSRDPFTICEQLRLTIPIDPLSHRSNEYDQIIGGILVKYAIELLHIRHIAWHSLNLPWIAKQLGIPVVFSFHDFYTICPTVNLLDERHQFCAGRCTATQGQCQVVLWSAAELPALKHQWIQTWQRQMAEMLQFVDAFVTTSESAKAQIQTIYPLAQVPFWVIPHGRDFPDFQSPAPQPSAQPLRILVPGNVNLHKGAYLIAQLHQLDQDRRLEFHFLGTTDPILDGIGMHHGLYQREDYQKLVQNIQPHAVGIFSIWPETYCHTLTESWASGVPVIAIDKGAVGERIRQHGGGWLIDSVDPGEIYARLLQIAADPAGYTTQIQAVQRWQQSYGRQNTIATMASAYHQRYQQVMDKTRPFRPQPRSITKVGVLVDRNAQKQFTPSTHIRVLEWLYHPLVTLNLDAQFLAIEDFLQDDRSVFDLDAVLVQRTVIAPTQVEALITACRQRQLPILYEIDDDLMQVPPAKDPSGFYAQTAPAIAQLVRAATAVLVSTAPLADRLRSLNPAVTVIPNRLPEFPWFRPLQPVLSIPDPVLIRSSDQFLILYMGNTTHIEDLAIVRPVFERLTQEGYPIQLFVIGGEPEDQSANWYQRLEIPESCKHYPEFVPWFRSLAAYFDLAIAPLTDTPFNRCKSALKFLQYSAVALPGIYSDGLPYRPVARSNQNGWLVPNTESAWYETILQCFRDRQSLPTVGQAAQQEVIDHHLMSQGVATYLAVFEAVQQGAAGDGRSTKRGG